MIYELSFEGHTVGYFPTEAEAVRRAGYLPKAGTRSENGKGTAISQCSTHKQTGNMSLQTNDTGKPFDLNSFFELYENALETQSNLIAARHDLVVENMALRARIRELERQLSSGNDTPKPKGRLIKLHR